MSSRTAMALMAGLQTERFVLRNLGLWESYRLTRRYWLSDPEIMAGVAPRLQTRSALRWFLSMERPNRRTKFTFAIEDKETGKLIGLNRVRLTAPSTATMTVAIHDRNWWGKRVVPEVRRALIDVMFDAGHVDRIAGQVLSRNIPAVFNYRALGFAHVGTLHRATQNAVTGAIDDVLIFELLKENWTGGAEQG